METLFAIGFGALLVWGFLFGGIFSDNMETKRFDKVSEDINETLRNRQEIENLESFKMSNKAIRKRYKMSSEDLI